MTTFIDWINISQNHFECSNLPSICGGYLTRQDDNFNHEWTVGTFDQHKGSHETSVSLRSFGSTVEVRGNVGRLNRLDNLFNLDFEKTIVSTNKIIGHHDLPAFTASPVIDIDSRKNVLLPNSTFYPYATVSMLHVTRNYGTGGVKEAFEFQNYLSTQSLSNIKRSRAGSTTVAWGKKGGRKYVKAYLKAQEMKAHVKNKNWTPQHQHIFEYCNDVGLVRIEFEMGRMFLKENGLRGLGDITMGKLIKLFDDMVEEPLLHPKRFESGYSIDNLSRKCRLAFVAWEKGTDLLAEDFCSKRTLYRYASEIREKLGVSILEKRDFDTLPVRYKTIQPIPLDVPDWYAMAA